MLLINPFLLVRKIPILESATIRWRRVYCAFPAGGTQRLDISECVLYLLLLFMYLFNGIWRDRQTAACVCFAFLQDFRLLGVRRM